MSKSGSRTSRETGSLLREYRNWDGYSRGDLAERVGISADELERWEILGVPIPPPKSFVTAAELVGIPASAVSEALSGQARHLPRDPIELYEAEPVIEDAIDAHGWSPEDVAEALATSPTKVQAWRLGVIEMTKAERLTLSSVLHLRGEPAGE